MEIIKECGLRDSELSERIGCSRESLYMARKTGKLADWHTASLLRALHSKGWRKKQLARKGKLDLSSLNFSAVARMIGVTPAVISEWIKYPQKLPESRKQQLLEVQEEIGDKLIRASRV